jgi:hypothetical protein
MAHPWVHRLLWQKRAGQWDQFEANERLFGVQNTCACRPPSPPRRPSLHPALDKCHLAYHGHGPAIDHHSSSTGRC